MKYVGKNIPRNDGFDKATGLGQFTMDRSILVTKLLLSQPKPRQSQLKPSSELK